MRITIRHLRGFVEVARLGSFTKAAEALRISQPALTVTINQLEEDLDTKLLERTTRSVKLMPSGKEFLEIADRLVKDFDSGLKTFNNGLTRKKQLLSVGESSSVGVYMLPQILPKFKDQYPNFNLKLETATDVDVQNMVKEEKVAFAISSPWEVDPELRYKEIAEDRFGIVCTRDNPLAHEAGPIAWAQLADQPFIIGGSQGTAQWGCLHKEAGIPRSILSPAIEASQTMSMLMLAEQGAGVAIVPELAWRTWPNNKLIFRPLVSPLVKREVRLVYKRHRHFPQEIRALMALYEEQAKKPFVGGKVAAVQKHVHVSSPLQPRHEEEMPIVSQKACLSS